jgi:plasmid maintenance system antidote protein VapI
MMSTLSFLNREAMTVYDPEKITETLAVQGRTINWLAEQTGYDPSTLSRFFNGKQPMSDQFAVRAARALGVPVRLWLTAPLAEVVNVA